MTSMTVDGAAPQQGDWLKRYYFSRAGVAGLWAALAFTLGKSDPVAAAGLLVAYPLYDAVANLLDARHSGGLGKAMPQAINVAVSLAACAAIAISLGQGMNAVLGVFGIWAIVAGLLQLAAGVRRWKASGAQWTMILSGAQSTIVGLVFIKQANASAVPTIADVAPYAVFGAGYFLVSGLWLTFRRQR